MGLTPHARQNIEQRTTNPGQRTKYPPPIGASSMSTETEVQHAQTVKVQSQKGTPTWEIAYLYPEQGQWTEAEYLALDTNRLIELSNGCLEFLPMPPPLHQLFLLFVLDHLRQYISERDLGMVFPSPMAIRLWQGQFREPDVVFLRHERLADLNSPAKWGRFGCRNR